MGILVTFSIWFTQNNKNKAKNGIQSEEWLNVNLQRRTWIDQHKLDEHFGVEHAKGAHWLASVQHFRTTAIEESWVLKLE